MRQITGKMIYYYHVCARKLWLFTHYIEMEQESELVAMGTLIGDNSFKRDEHDVLVNGVISADFIRKGYVVHEVKKRCSIPEADMWQLRFYLYNMKLAGVREPRGVLHYAEDHEKLEVVLTDDDIADVEQQMEEIKTLMSASTPPAYRKKAICRSCAYYELCAI